MYFDRTNFDQSDSNFENHSGIDLNAQQHLFGIYERSKNVFVFSIGMFQSCTYSSGSSVASM